MTTQGFREVIERTHPHLLIMEQYISDIANGVVSFDVRVNDGRVQDVLIKRVERVKL